MSLSEHEAHWKAFLKSLKDRGLKGMRLIISDDHKGLGAARRAVFGSVLWQRCQVHQQQNACAYLPKQAMKLEVAASTGSMFNATDRKTAEELLQAAVQKYALFAACLSAWLEDKLSEGFSVFDFPFKPRRMILTNNSLESINIWRGKPFKHKVSAGRLELPTNGLKGHCSTIELRTQAKTIVTRYFLSVNK